MASPIGSMNNVKIFVLYLMRNINYPLDFVTINEIVMQTDYIMYLDFAVAFHEMLDGELICEEGTNERGEPLYAVTSRGAMVAEQLRSDLLPSILDRSLACALRHLDFKRRGITVDCSSEPLGNQTFRVSFIIREKDKILMQTSVNVDSEYRSRQMRENFRERPDVIYRGILALLTGNVNYLFDK
ncbi:MAG: DUF4364 family protein [Clostridia bacterium]|nr:DUF4364 family protein [Clostridia bacterium]